MADHYNNNIPLRSLLPALKNKQYFNYGGQGPLPDPALEQITQSWKDIQKLGPFTNRVWPYIYNEINKTKKLLADICGVNTSQIALTENVTSGCVLPLWGLPLREGDQILISNCEHPGVVAACREIAVRQQLKVDIVNLKDIKSGVEQKETADISIMKRIEEKLTSKTKLVVISHILWNTGQVIPISSIGSLLKSHYNKPFFLVDGAQSFGQMPIDKDVALTDIYAFTGHKWALGPEGLGGVALSKRVLEESKPTLIGWRSLKNETNIEANFINPYHLDSRRFEIATSCIPLLAGLRCSLKLLEDNGTSLERFSKILDSSRMLWEGLGGIESITNIIQGAPPSGLVSFSVDSKSSAKEIVSKLGESELWIRDLEDPVCLRACVHITTTQEEIENLTKAVRKLLS